MATTTNYGWTTPDDTALVKDGAAAIRTLGSSVDTTTKALNPSTTLGDIEYRSSTANTNTRLGIGSNGQYLTVSSGVPAWGDISAGGMTLISTTTLTGSSVTLNSIPSTYNNLQIIVKNYKPASNDTLLMRLNGDTATNYISNRASASTPPTTWGSTDLVMCNAVNSSSSYGLGIINIPAYTAATWKTIQSTFVYTYSTSSTDVGFFLDKTGYYQGTSAISSINLRNDSGGNFTSGTILLYGVK